MSPAYASSPTHNKSIYYLIIVKHPSRTIFEIIKKNLYLMDFFDKNCKPIALRFGQKFRAVLGLLKIMNNFKMGFFDKNGKRIVLLCCQKWLILRSFETVEKS